MASKDNNPKSVHELGPPSLYFTNKTSWNEREQYGKMMRELIGTQLTQCKLEKNRIKKTKITQNIGYLVQVLGSLINSDKTIEERIKKLEELAGLAKKGVITK